MYLGDLRISQVKRILLYCMKYFQSPCVPCSKQETRATGVKFTHLLQCHNSLWKMWLKNDILPQVCCRTDVSPNNQNVKSSLMWWRVAGTWSKGKVSQIIEGFHNRFFLSSSGTVASLGDIVKKKETLACIHVLNGYRSFFITASNQRQKEVVRNVSSRKRPRSGIYSYGSPTLSCWRRNCFSFIVIVAELCTSDSVWRGNRVGQQNCAWEF